MTPPLCAANLCTERSVAYVTIGENKGRCYVCQRHLDELQKVGERSNNPLLDMRKGKLS